MLIRNQKTLNLGGLLGLSFIGILLVIFSPVFGGKNGLEYSDDLFNKLAKGSSYFIPEIAKSVREFDGKNISVAVKMDKPETAQKAAKMLLVGGAQVGVNDAELKITGDLGKLLGNVLKDSDAMYKNDGAKISSLYGADELDVMSVWWNVLNRAARELQKEKKVEEANIAIEVMRKGVEPAYNFYKIEAQSVADKAGILGSLLVFYVVYTMWWGYSIFYIFDGLGLTMKKAKVKKEV
jgi:hypothetical protein